MYWCPKTLYIDILTSVTFSYYRKCLTNRPSNYIKSDRFLMKIFKVIDVYLRTNPNSNKISTMFSFFTATVKNVLLYCVLWEKNRLK